jgi:hypothetical protein
MIISKHIHKETSPPIKIGSHDEQRLERSVVGGDIFDYHEVPGFSNQQRLQYYYKKVRNRCFRDSRDLFSIPQLEDKIAREKSVGKVFLQVKEDEWIRLRIIDFKSNHNLTYVSCTSLLSCLLLDECDILNVDVYHGSRKKDYSLHHFGISSLLRKFNNQKIILHDFIFSCFTNNLSESSFRKMLKCFY